MSATSAAPAIGRPSLLDRKEPGTSLALFRIACGVTVLAALGSVLVHGLAPVLWLDARDGGYASVGEPPWLLRAGGQLFPALGQVSPLTLGLLLAAALTSALAVTLGLGGRSSAFILLQSYLALSSINQDSGGGGDDRLIYNALWLLVLAPATATLSLDCRLRTGAWTSDEPVAAWPRYLAIYQIVLVYFTTGLQKLGIHWMPSGGYSALYYYLQDPACQRFDMSWLAWVFPLTQVATATTWLWEVGSPLLLLALWYRRTAERPGRLRALFNAINFRRWFVVIGLMLHLGIWIFIDIAAFSWISMSFYFCFYQPSEWRRGKADADTPSSAPREESSSRLAAVSRWSVRGLVAFHLIAITLSAIPAPPVGLMNRESWDSPFARAEFDAWAETLNHVGFNVSRDELREALWELGTGWLALRQKLLAPFEWYYRYFGTAQNWRMFSGPSQEATRIIMDIEEGGDWRPIFVQSSREHAWRSSQLSHEHIRTALDMMVLANDHARLTQFAHWAAGQAAEDFPRAARFRLKLHTFRIATQDEVREGRRPQGADRWSVAVELDAVRRGELKK